jgi:hypothetical protein
VFRNLIWLSVASWSNGRFGLYYGWFSMASSIRASWAWRVWP